MAKLEGQWVPETEAELELIRSLYEVTGDARKAGVPTMSIVGALAFASGSIAMHGGQTGSDGPARPLPETHDDGRQMDCPNCGDRIDDVKWYIGGDGDVMPCGCAVDMDDLPGWDGL